MASVTLAESAKLSQDEMVRGVIENVITVDHMFQVLPFDGIEGNALAYNRENALGDAQALEVGSAVTAKAAATFSQISSGLTTLVGDAEVNGLIQATRSNMNDQTAIQIASKSKSVGRAFRDMMINGDSSSPEEFDGLLKLCAAGQKVATATNGSNISFLLLDSLLDLVVDKDGVVDWMTMPARTIRSYFALLRALGGANIGDVVTLPNGAQVPAYRGTPIFRNDYIPVNQTQAGSGAVCTTVMAGTFDDGSRQHGIAGLTAAKAAGIQVVDVGEQEAYDNRIWRVKWYVGMALFSEKGLAAIPGVLD